MVAQPVAVVGGVREQGLPRSDGAQHIVDRAAIMGLSGGQLERDRQAVHVGDRMDLGGQAAP